NDGGTFSDNCALDTSSFQVAENTNGACPTTITRIFTIEDNCGNQNTCQQVITVNDDILPSIACPSNVVVECINELPGLYTDINEFVSLGGTMSDNCGLDSLSFLVSDVDDGNTCPKSLIRTVAIDDLCGNSSSCQLTITINDVTPPTMACPAITVWTCPTDLEDPFDAFEFISNGGTMADNCGLDLSTFGVTEANNGTTCPTIYTRTYVVADSCGNTASCVHQVTVNDTIPPVVSCPPDVTVDCFADIPPQHNVISFVSSGGMATDNCGIDVGSFAVSETDDMACLRTIQRTYSLADSCGTLGSCVQTFTVMQPAPGTPASTSDTSSCYSGIVLPAPPTVTDACGTAMPIVNGPIESTPIPPCDGVVTYTWTYEDCAGQQVDYVHMVTIEVSPPGFDPVADATITCAEADALVASTLN
ncbi:MAG: hypothetical protein R3330_15955, partial [Saprospiraceae bacterium]|nr:hypothetical protein [Saprospiraceae bacterium]